MKPEPSYPKHRAKLTLAACLAALFAVSLVPLQAQEVAADTKPALDADKDVVTLSPFEVSSDTNVGYQATSTLAGTRLQTKVRDIGSSISIVNEEFLRDTNSNNLENVLIFTPNTEVAGLSGNFSGYQSGNSVPEEQRDNASGGKTRVRGLASADLTRNYFITDVPFDSFNTESITVQRGANSALFGLGSPGGVINNSTIKADFLGNRGEVKATTDTYGTQRFSMRYNQMVGDFVAIRVAGLNERKQYEQKQAFTDDDRAFVAVTVKLPFNLTARGSYEQAKRHESRPDYVPPSDGITPWLNFGKPVFTSPAEAGAFYRGTGGFFPGVKNDQVITLAASGISTGFANFYQDPSNPNATFNGTTFVNRGGIPGNYSIPGSLGEWMMLQLRPESEIIRRTGFRSDGTAVAAGSAPFYNAGNVDYQITDRSIYDYRENNFTGGSAQEDSKWKIYNAALEGTWLDNRLGLEVSYNKQEMTSTGNNSLQGAYQRTIYIDPNQYMIATTDGTGTGPLVANPNYGRPVMGGLSGGNLIGTEREAKRATGFAEFRAEDFLADGWVSKLLGKLRLTGLVSQDNTYGAERYGRDQLNARIVSQATSGGVIGGTGVGTAGYRVGQVFALPVASNTNFLNATSISGLAGADIRGVSYGTQRDRPVTVADYVGWDSVSQKFVTFNSPSYTLLDDDSYPSAFYAGKSASELKSEVFVAQHYLWDNAIVLTGTWRKDSQSSASVGAPTTGITSGHPGVENIYNAAYMAGPQRPFGVDADGVEATSWSIMIHTPDFVKRYLPTGWELSAYKSKADNFKPTAGRVNIYNEQIAPVMGTTEEEGFIVDGFDGKLSARVNFYTTQVANNSFDKGGVSSTEGVLLNLAKQLDNPANVAQGFTAANAQAVLPGPGTIALQGFVPDWANADATTSRNSNDNGTQDFKATGMEIEVAYNPTPHWTLLLTAGKQTTVTSNTYPALKKYVADFVLPQWVNSNFAKNYFIDDTASQTLAQYAQLNIVDPVARAALEDGNPSREQRKWSYAFNTSYNFGRNSSLVPNWLGDLTVGGGYRWADKAAIGYGVSKNSFGDYALDLAQPFYTPSQNFVDLFFRTRFALPHDRALSVQLNVKDLTNHDGLIPYIANPDGSEIYRISEGRLITLSATFEF